MEMGKGMGHHSWYWSCYYLSSVRLYVSFYIWLPVFKLEVHDVADPQYDTFCPLSNFCAYGLYASQYQYISDVCMLHIYHSFEPEKSPCVCVWKSGLQTQLYFHSLQFVLLRVWKIFSVSLHPCINRGAVCTLGLWLVKPFIAHNLTVQSLLYVMVVMCAELISFTLNFAFFSNFRLKYLSHFYNILVQFGLDLNVCFLYRSSLA